MDTAAAVPHASGTAEQRPLSEVLAGTALAERLQVQRTHGGRVGHLIPRLGAQERQYRSKFSVALCGAHVHFEPGRAGSPILQRPGCRRCAAVLRELTSTPDTDGIRWSASTGGTVLHAWTALSRELAAAHVSPRRPHGAADLRLPPVKAACSKVFTPDPGAALTMRARDAGRSSLLPRCERCQARLAARDGRLPPPTSDMLF